MKKNKLMALALLGSLTMGLLSGCAKNDSNLTTITLALDWTPNTNHTGFYVADELGYFEEMGIDIEIIEALESGAESVVASGTAQFGISFQDYLVPVYSAPQNEQLPITTVAAIVQHNTSGIISPKELNINSPKDLCGHSYATWNLEIEQAIMKKVVTEDGGDWNQVNLTPQYVENIGGAFESGIDAVWIYYGWDGINTELNEIETNFFYFKDYGEELDYYSPVIIANNDFLENNSELAKDFMKAVTKGYEYAIENPEESARILANASEGLDVDLCIASQTWISKKYKDDAACWGVIDEERWDAFFAWVYENGLCENEIPSGYGFTNDYIDDGR